MKLRIAFPVLIIICALASSCDKTFKTYTANVPEYISFDDFRSQQPYLGDVRDVKNPGKIYIKGDYLFINERFRGVHIFDNSNPSDPVGLGFIAIHANLDMAMKNNIMYVDSYTDLLAIDLSDPLNPALVSRTENVFDFNNGAVIGGLDINYPIADFNPESGVIIGWNLEEVTTESHPSYFYPQNEWLMVDAISIESSFASDPTFGSVGIGGSMARFTIAHDHLYILQEQLLSTFDITIDSSPTHTNDDNITRLAETLFPHGDHLFIGTTSGMIIYSLATPADPIFVSDYDHWVSCDPVFVSGDYAYITLSEGGCSWNPVNQLEVIDISNLNNPELVAEYPMTNPKGLSVDNETLFLCDSNAGLLVFDIADPLSIDEHLLAEFPYVNAWDVIAHNELLLVIGTDGLYQYSYTDVNNLLLLSIIPTL